MEEQKNTPNFKIKYGTNDKFINKELEDLEEGGLYFCFKDDPQSEASESKEAHLYGVLDGMIYNIAPLYKEDVNMEKNLVVEKNATIYGRLTIDNSGIENAQIPVLNDVNLIVGTPSTQHLEIDNNEILSKSNTNTASILYLNKDTQIEENGQTTLYKGGQVSIGSGGIKSKGTILITKTTDSSLSAGVEDELPALVIGNISADRLEIDRNEICAKIYDSQTEKLTSGTLYLNTDTEIVNNGVTDIINGGLVYIGHGGLKVQGEVKLGYDDNKVIIGTDQLNDKSRPGENSVKSLDIHNNVFIGKFSSNEDYEDRLLNVYGDTTIGCFNREKDLKVYGNTVIGDEGLEANNIEKSLIVYGEFTNTGNSYLAYHGGNVAIGDNNGQSSTEDSLKIYNNIILGTSDSKRSFDMYGDFTQYGNAYFAYDGKSNVTIGKETASNNLLNIYNNITLGSENYTKDFDMYGDFKLNGSLELDSNPVTDDPPFIFIKSDAPIDISYRECPPLSIGINDQSEGDTLLEINNNTILSKVWAETGSYKGGTLYLNPDDGSLLGGTIDIGSGGVFSKGSIILKSTSRGYFLTDSVGYEYPGIYDNGSNLWIGSKQTAEKHHHGSTYISSGFNRTSINATTKVETGTGNETIFISVPNANNTDASNYKVFHHGMVSNSNRIVYKNSSNTLVSSGHYINDGKIAVNYAAEPTNDNFFVNGTANINSFARFITIIEKGRDNKTDVYRNCLVIHGPAYGNLENDDDANSYLTQKYGELSWGDPGPQIIFKTGDGDPNGDGQKMALIYSDHNQAGGGIGNTLSLVSSESSSQFTAYNIKAFNKLYVGNSYFLDTGTSSAGKASTPSYLAINTEDAPVYALDVHGSAKISNRLIVGSDCYGTDLPTTDNVAGRVFFKLV